MPTLEVPVWMQNDTYAAAQDRTLIDNLWAVDGIINVGDMAVSQRAAGTNMSVDVASGVGVVTGDDTTAQGKYLIRHLSGPTNVALTAAPGTGNSRIDLIVARIRDAAVIGGSFNDFIFDKVTGTPAATGSQVAPALPNSCMQLAQVLVGANVSTIVNANITDMRRRAWDKNGGTVICTATTRPTAPWAGLLAFETDTGRLVAYTGAAWVTISSIGNVHVRAHRQSAWATSATPNLQTAFIFDTEDYDNAANYNPATGFFTAAVPGVVQFSCRIAATSTATGQFLQCFLRHNNVQEAMGSTGISSATGQIIDTVLPAYPVQMAASDNCQLFVVSGTASLTGAVNSDAVWMAATQTG